MKKKVLAALMAVLMVVGLAGCGSEKNSVAESKATESTVVSQAETQPSTEESEASIEDVGEEEESESVVEENGDMEENVEDEVSTVEESQGDIYFALIGKKINGLHHDWTVYKLDLDDFSCEQISRFEFTAYDPTIDFAKEKLVYYETYRHLYNSAFAYSEDFLKCAATLKLESGEQHAGWLNSDGTFTDVSEATGEASKSEFEAAKHFVAMCFTDDGRFIYRNQDDETIHYVYVDNPSVSYDYDDSLIPEYKQIDSTPNSYYLTDWWIEEGYYIGDIRDSDLYSGAIINVHNYEDHEFFFSGDSQRYCWCMKLSPDKKSVAFISERREDRGDAALYIMDLETREPVRMPCNIFDGYEAYNTMQLLDWR